MYSLKNAATESKEKSNNMTANPTQTASALIKTACANYAHGQCLPKDSNCTQLQSNSLICKYFLEAVLPLSPTLHAKIMSNTHAKQCTTCHRLFRAVTPYAKHCHQCTSTLTSKSEVTATQPVTKTLQCVQCTTLFIPNSNRAKYCHVCSKQMRQEKKNEWLRKYRSEEGYIMGM